MFANANRLWERVCVSKLTPKGWQKISQGLSGAQPLVNTLTQCRTLKACEDSSHPLAGPRGVRVSAVLRIQGYA